MSRKAVRWPDKENMEFISLKSHGFSRLFHIPHMIDRLRDSTWTDSASHITLPGPFMMSQGQLRHSMPSEKRLTWTPPSSASCILHHPNPIQVSLSSHDDDWWSKSIWPRRPPNPAATTPAGRNWFQYRSQTPFSPSSRACREDTETN